jgi:hypothetical protein
MIVLACVLYAQPAAAYLDPASGSLIIQAVLAGIAGLLVFLRMFWHRIVTMIRRDAPPQETSEPETDPPS